MEGLQKSILIWRNSKSISSNQYKTMTVQFDITSAPGYGTYLDDATDMPYGKTSEAITQWQEFFGYKPCLFKDGEVVGYLNPNDYTKFEDGTDADITSGYAGDVMVEFPRRGIKIIRSGSTVTVSMTNNPNDEDFTYYAHTRYSLQKDYFYIGVYLGYTAYGSILRSLSGKTPENGVTLEKLRSWSEGLGPGYMEVGFYQFLFIQCMYLLQYKGNLDSQSVHGFGYCNGSRIAKTGLSDTKGVMYGTTSGSSNNDHIKLFGIEDFWGNKSWFLDGYYTNGMYHVLTATDGFNNTGSGYIDNGAVTGSSYISGFISNAVCSPEVGFTPIECVGTQTHFKDWGSVNSYCIPIVGGHYNYALSSGIFRFSVSCEPKSGDTDTCGRLCYL